METLQDGVDAREAPAAQRHLELLHRLEHLPVEIGRSIAPEELRATLERLRGEGSPAAVEAPLAATPPKRHAGREEDASVAREAFRQGWEAAYAALRDWLLQRGRAV